VRRAKRSCCCAAQVSGHCDHWTHLLPRLQPGRRSPMKLGVLTHQIGISWISWTKNCQQYDIWVCLKSCTAKKPLRIFTSHHFHHDFHHDFWSSLGYHIQTRPPIEKPKTLNSGQEYNNWEMHSWALSVNHRIETSPFCSQEDTLSTLQ